MVMSDGAESGMSEWAKSGREEEVWESKRKRECVK